MDLMGVRYAGTIRFNKATTPGSFGESNEAYWDEVATVTL